MISEKYLTVQGFLAQTENNIDYKEINLFQLKYWHFVGQSS